MRVLASVVATLLYCINIQSQKLIYTVDNISSSYVNAYTLDISNCKPNLWCWSSDYLSSFSGDIVISPITNEVLNLVTAPDLFFYNKLDSCTISSPGPIIVSPQTRFINQKKDIDSKGFIWLYGDDGFAKVKPNTIFFDFKGPIITPGFKGIGEFSIQDNIIYMFSIKQPTEIPARIYLLKLDTSDLNSFSIIGSWLRNDYDFGPIATLPVSCGVYRLIAGTKDALYEIDKNDASISHICDIPMDPRSEPNLLNFAFYWPYDPRDCDVFIDLDIDNSSGDLKNGYKENITCNSNSIRLNDRDINVYSDYGTMDSITLEIVNPFVSEGFYAFDNYQVRVKYNNFHITLYPKAGATNDSFELMINSIKYHNLSCPYIKGERKIEIITYKNNLKDTAYCTLDIKERNYYAGLDSSNKYCSNDPLVDINTLLDPCTTLNGRWIHKLANSKFINPALDSTQLLYYIVGDSVCGFDTSKHFISISQLPDELLPQDTSICLSDSLIINLPVNYFYIWQDNSINSRYIINKPGTYIVKVTNSFNCSIYDSIIVIVEPNILLKRNQYICGDDEYIYNNRIYKPGDVITDTLNSNNSCDTMLNVLILPYPSNSVFIKSDTLICRSSNTTLLSSSFKKYFWSTSETTQSIQVGAGIYTVTVTDDNGCTNSTSIIVKEAEEIKTILKAFDPNCPNERGSIDLSNSKGGIGDLTYFLNGIKSRTGIYNNLDPGTYYLRIIDSLGCEKLDTIIILPAEEFLVDIQSEIELEQNSTALIPYNVVVGSLSLISINPNKYIALEGSGFRITAIEEIEYTLNFEDENGCIVRKILKVKVKKNEEFFVPSIFSPNGDGINDEWTPVIGSSYKVQSMSIYDRWGELVYSDFSKISWDGRNHGKELNPGVFIYVIQVLNEGGAKKEFIGELTLVR